MPCCGARAERQRRIRPTRLVTVCGRCGHWLAEDRGVLRIMTLDDQEDIAAHRPDLVTTLREWTLEVVERKPCCKGAMGDA